MLNLLVENFTNSNLIFDTRNSPVGKEDKDVGGRRKKKESKRHLYP